MSKIHIKMLTEDALNYMKKNIDYITKKIQENDTNEWIYTDFPTPIFKEKKFYIDDFELEKNDESKNKEIDLSNSILLHKKLKHLPLYILTSENFWLWLYLEKFYVQTKSMMKVNGSSTIKDHWMFGQGNRRGLFFGVLSRCYFRVDMTIDEESVNKYHLTKWVIENPERFRGLTWRSYSSQIHLVRGILKGQKRAIEELGFEDTNIYPIIAKFVSEYGSVKLLDVVSEVDIETLVYDRIIDRTKN